MAGEHRNQVVPAMSARARRDRAGRDRRHGNGPPRLAVELRSSRHRGGRESTRRCSRPLEIDRPGNSRLHSAAPAGAYLAGVNGARNVSCFRPGVGAGSADYRRSPSAAALWSGEVTELRSARIPVLVYTVNDTRPSGLAEHLAVIGVDGLFTDDPAGMKILFA